MLFINKKKLGTRCFLLAGLLGMFAVLSSFSGTWGGDSYSVYVNNKLVLEQFVHLEKGVKSIQLNHAALNDQVRVYYNHCGEVGKSRKLAIADANQKILKEWTYADVSGKDRGMTCISKDILALQKAGGNKLNLYYSSKEMPKAKLLASIIITKDNITTP